jgi:hypothetical protein
MPLPWLTVLQSVPWTDVIRNAPKVAEGAKKLWSAVGKKPQPSAAGDAVIVGAPADAPNVAALQARLTTLEASVADLHGQMVASSELIKALANQNTLLIQRIEVNRVRWLWLGGAVGVIGAIAVAALMMAWR